MCFNIPESKRDDVKDRQNQDKDFLVSLFDTKLNCALGDEDIIKPVRLGKRSEENDKIKCRPFRFSVRSFQVKTELLKASMLLRVERDEIFSSIISLQTLLNFKELKLSNFARRGVIE